MIRFQPDTWREALLRPLAMASPEGSVYVEIIAPDFRFLFIIVLAIAWLVLARGEKRRSLAAPLLLAVTAVAFWPWLATTGNGRYFIPFLLIAGPLCIGLLHLVPSTRTFRVVAAVAMVMWQAFLIYEIDPWRFWGHVVWSEGPPFEITVPSEITAQPATYVTLSSISYSLIAPSFHPASRWVNIAPMAGASDMSADGLRTQAVIAAPGPLNVIFPTVPGGQEGEAIDEELGTAIDALLARQGLSLEATSRCRLLRSAGLAGMASSKLADGDAGKPGLHGFWLCPLTRHASVRVINEMPLRDESERTFEKLERTCPRIFAPGSAVSLRIPTGAVRGYPGSDFKIYVFDDGRVFYKYYRALNAVEVGKVDAVLAASFAMNCDRIRGRSGLPWEREI
jgi:hypothetical protein